MAENKPKDIWEELRKPFPKGAVGSLPKPYKKDSVKGNCNVCGGYHGLPAVHLDYIGHAAVTDRLNTVDPTWTWEPMAFDQYGSPALDRDGNLWIKLTIGGVTRLGVGDGNNMKERIGDALRNAAMRFGVALDLWSKDELESHIEAPELKNDKPQRPSYQTSQTAPEQPQSEEPPAPSLDTPNPKARQTPNKAKFDELTHAFNSIYMTENVKKIDFIRGILGHPMPNNDEEVDRIIKAIEDKK